MKGLLTRRFATCGKAMQGDRRAVREACRDETPHDPSHSERDDSQSWNGLEVPYIRGRDAVAKLQRRRRD
jgi:hypothetical protein